MPPGLSISSAGVISGTPTAAGNYSFGVQVSDSSSPALTASRTFSIVVNSASVLTITTAAALPAATTGNGYSVALTATGGAPPYAWALTGGNMPPGLIISSAGVISGTPTTAGNYSLGVQVSDRSSPTLTTSRTFTLLVVSPLMITTSTLPNGTVAKTYSATLTASEGTSPYSWSVSVGTLPPGLTLSTEGVISGTPATASTVSFTVLATDSAAPPQTAAKTLTITIQSQVTITTSTPLPVAVVGAFYSLTLEAPGISPLTWTVISGIAPPGMTLTTSGALAGSPTVAGTFDFTVQASGGDPVQTATKQLRVTVNEALKIVTDASLPDAALGARYSATLEAAGGVPPYTWTSLGRGLPAGLTLSSSGVISGIPTGIGGFSFTIQVADSFTPVQEVSRTFTIVVSAAISITTTSLPTATQNMAYSQQLEATGTPPFTWIVTAGTVPAGLTLTTSGLLQGTPTEVAAKTVTITVTDARGATAAREFVILVDPPFPSLSVTGLPAMLTARQVLDLSINLSVPHPSPLTGQLKLSFTPNAEVASDDPATLFSSGSRTANFTIPANTTAAVFSSRLMLLTGTVAGTVRLTTTFDNGPADVPLATADIPAVAPQITEVTATRTPGGLDIQITGFAPARRVSSVEFSFEMNGGQRVSLPRNVETEFAEWYRSPASTPFGSVFSFLQSFAVQGDAKRIEGVTVRLTNAQGSSTSSTVPMN
jgi:hypothetical protein